MRRSNELLGARPEAPPRWRWFHWPEGIELSAASRVDPPGRDTLIVLAVAAAVLVAILVVSVALDAYNIYDDGRSRLTAARAVIDGRQPGFAQFGYVWLPLHGLLMLPLVWNDWMYRTGLAGVVISAAAFLATVGLVHRITFTLTSSRGGAIVATVVLLLSPNLLFLATTPMSELPFLAAFTGACAYLARWARTRFLGDLVLAAGCAAAATGIRYDGWVLLPVGTAFVVLTQGSALRIRDGRERATGEAVAYATLVALPIVLWFLYNAIVFGSPIAFAVGAASASNFSRFAGEQAIVRGDLLRSSAAYGSAAIDNVGLPMLLVSAAAVVVAALRVRQWRGTLALLLPASVIAFNIVSLYIGASVLRTPHLVPDATPINIRYGMLAAPFVAVAAGVLASHGAVPLLAVLVTAVLQVPTLVPGGRPVTVTEPQRVGVEFMRETPRAIRNVYDAGLILVSFGDHASVVAASGLPLSVFVHEGITEVEPTYAHATADPARHVRYVIVRDPAVGFLGDLMPPGALERDFEVVAEIWRTGAVAVDRIYRVRPEAERRAR